MLGTNGLTGADRILIGSTTLSILQRTTIPVLAVPPLGLTDQRVSASWPEEQIVAALELDTDSPREVEIAARVARWFGSSLLWLHVVSKIPAPAWLRGDLSAHDRIRVAQSERQIDNLADVARRHVKTDARVICGRVSDEIAALAATERTGLLMTALRDRQGWFGSARGAVSYHVLSRAVTPVLAYPSRWRF